MTYVEESRARTNRQMFVDDTTVLNGHLPTSELHDLSARAPMGGIKRSPLHSLSHGILKSAPTLAFALQVILGGFQRIKEKHADRHGTHPTGNRRNP